MSKVRALIVGFVLLLGTVAARADVLFIVTTDGNLSNNGGVDEFIPIPADGFARPWIASKPVDRTETDRVRITGACCTGQTRASKGACSGTVG